MILFKATNSNNAYTLNIITANGHIIYMKYDTGASFTTIPYSLLQDVIKSKEVNNIKYYNYNKVFKTASSKNVTGTLCSIENVKIGSLKFPILYFFLVFNTNRDVGLIGYDIIANCKFNHDIGGDIIVSEFDAKKYKAEIIKLCGELHEISFNECSAMCTEAVDVYESEIEIVDENGKLLSDNEIIKMV